MALSPVETGTVQPVSGGPALKAIRFEEIYEAAGNVGTTGVMQPPTIVVPPSDSNDFSDSLIAAIL